MNGHSDNFPSRDEQVLPADVAGLGRMLDARGAAQREALSAEALERIAAISDLQLPIQGADAPVVIARIGPSADARRESVRRFWRVAAAIAVIVSLGGAAVLALRGFSGSEPAPGTLVDGSQPGRPGVPGTGTAVPNIRTAPAARPLAAEHLEHALASQSRSAAAVVVALSNPSNEPSIHYPDMDDALAADIAPLFQAGSLLDGGGMTYEDLSGEFAALVAPGSFH